MNRLTYIIASLSILMLIFHTSYSQSAQEARYAFSKKIKSEAPGISIILQGEPEIIMTALEKKFNPDGKHKPKSMKRGLYMHEALVIPEISQATLNYYYKVEKTGKSGESRVTLFLSPGNDNFWTSAKFPNEMNAAKRVLEHLNDEIYHAELMQAFDIQAKTVQKALNQQKDLLKEQESLAKERERLKKAMAQLERDAEKNIQDQQSHNEVVRKERAKLNVIEAELNTLSRRQ